MTAATQAANVVPLFPGQEITPPRIKAPNPADTFDPKSIVWVTDDQALHRLHQAIETAFEVVVDLETTGLNEHATAFQNGGVPARIVLASLTLPSGPGLDVDPPTYVLPLSHPKSPWLGHWRSIFADVCRTILKHRRPLVNHHLKFDLRWGYAHTGVDLSPLHRWDTMLSSHMLDENSSTKLKVRAPATFGVDRWDDHDLSKPGAAEKVPIFELGTYAARDTYWTWKLSVVHRRIMNINGDPSDYPEDQDQAQDWNLGQLAVWCEMPKGATLAAMEQRGLAVDRDWVIHEGGKLEKIRRETFDWLVSLYDVPGEPSFAPTSLWFRAWTEEAVAAGDLRIMAMTKNRNPQWNKAVLSRQARRGSEVAAVLLRHRDVVKKLEFLTSWQMKISPAGRIHSTYNAGRVITGRLSSSEPNLQQVTKKLKPAFVPSPGYLIAEIDYSQIELRAAAFIARCEPMLEAYRQGQDLHRLFAAHLTGKDPKDVTADERQHAKAGNFGLLYAISPEGFQIYAETAYGVELTDVEAAATHAAFFQMWDGMAQWHARVVKQAHREGQVVSPIGRVRRLPDINCGREYLESQAERQAINSPVQGFASDLMQMAASSIEGNLPGVKSVPAVRLVGTVHDSILVEVPEDDWQRSTARCMHRMIHLDRVLAELGCHLDVPLAAEAVVGTRWGLGDVGVIS